MFDEDAFSSVGRTSLALRAAWLEEEKLEEAWAKHEVSWLWVCGHNDHELDEQADA